MADDAIMSRTGTSRSRGFEFLLGALTTPKLSAVMSLLFVSLSIPILIFYGLGQKAMTEGLTVGGVKG